MVNVFEEFIRNVRFGARNLWKNPSFAFMAIASLALGIGAATAMYSVIYAVLIDPFPYKDVKTLVSPKVEEPGKRGWRTYYTLDQYLQFAEHSRIFDGLTISTIDDVLWTSDGDPQRLRGNHVTFNGFDVMGVAPLIGRVTSTADADPNAEPVVVFGYRFWQKQFGGDPSVLGRRLTLDGKPRTVIGVMPQRFMWRGADVYIPIAPRRGEAVEGVRMAHVVGRLKPGVTAAQVEADLKPIVEELKRESPKEFPEKWRVGIVGFADQFQSGLRDALIILFGAVGLLLLISCVNVSNLLLSKATARNKEIAVRASLGASRFRIVRQLLSESLVLAVCGGVLGMAVAKIGLAGIIAMVPPNTIPDEALIALNVPVMLFALAVSVGAALIFGVAPALHLSGNDVATPLKEAGRGNAGTARQKWLRSTLVVGEVALSLMLLVGASLMIRTLFAIQSIDIGMKPDRVLTLRVPLSEKRYPDVARRNAFMNEVLRRTGTIPGVQAVGLTSGLPPLWDYGFTVEVSGNATADNRRVLTHNTNQDYVKAVGIGLVQGRLLEEHEVANAAHVALINQAFVRRYLPGGDAIGRVVNLPRLRTTPFSLTDSAFQIVGVVRDTLNDIPQPEPMPELFIPYTVIGSADRLVVLSQLPPDSLASAIRGQIHAIDKDQPVSDVRTVETILKEQVYSQPRFNLLLFTIFAALGLLLALMGIYGVVSSSVAQRTQEIGIRMALGASFSEVIRMVLTGGLKLIGAGVLLGLAGSLISARLLAQQVWKHSTFDPYSFVAVTLLVFTAGLAACFWPARTAARIDPISALRHE